MTPAEPGTQKRVRANPGSSLSARELEILTLLSIGLSNKEIGTKLDLSPNTVRNHLSHVFEKLRVRSRTEAVVAFLKAENKLGRVILHSKYIA